MNPSVNRLFADVEDPRLTAWFAAGVYAGIRFRADVLPDELVVPALLLNAVAREYGEVGVVDRASELSRRVNAWLVAKNDVGDERYLVNLIFSGLPLAGRQDAMWVGAAWKELKGVFD
jgi:hypothetical protein